MLPSDYDEHSWIFSTSPGLGNNLVAFEKACAFDYVARELAGWGSTISTKQQPLPRIVQSQRSGVTKGFSVMSRLANLAASNLPNHYQGRIIHPALHFEDDFASVGIIENTTANWVITSDGLVVPATNPGSLIIQPPPLMYGDLANRWGASDVEEWLKGDLTPSLAQTLNQIRDWLDHYVQFRQPEEASLIACWTLGTYFYPLFPAYPRLNLVGERESGKSKLEHLIALVAFNGLLRLNPTPAVLFRIINPLRPTLCLDEVESLAGEDHKAMLSIINAGYKANGAVDRVAGQNFDRLHTFQVYSPMVLAGIAGLNETTESRCITILMERANTKDKLNRDVIPTGPIFPEIRSRCYRHTLTDFQDIRQSMDALALPDWLTGRLRELYQPLLTIATLAEQRGGSGWVNDLLVRARKDRADRGGLSFRSEAILDFLWRRMQSEEELDFRPLEFVPCGESELGFRITAEQAGQALRRLGFPKRRDGRGTVYHVTRERLETLTGEQFPK